MNASDGRRAGCRLVWVEVGVDVGIACAAVELKSVAVTYPNTVVVVLTGTRPRSKGERHCIETGWRC